MNDLEAKKHKTEFGSYYGTPEISSVLAGFESGVIGLHNARRDYKSGSKAYAKHWDEVRLEAATRIMQLIGQREEWWVTNHDAPADNQKVSGPYSTSTDAGKARAILERFEHHHNYWIEELSQKAGDGK